MSELVSWSDTKGDPAYRRRQRKILQERGMQHLTKYHDMIDFGTANNVQPNQIWQMFEYRL